MTGRDFQASLLAWIWACSMLLSGCGGGSSSAPAQPQPPVHTPAPVPEPPDSSLIGLPPGVVLVPWPGPAEETRSDLVLEGFEFPALPPGAYYRFSGSNVVLRNCRIHAGVLLSGNAARIEHCEVVGGISVSGASDVVIDRNVVHSSADDLMHITSDTGRVQRLTVTNNKLHAPRPACGAHADGIQVRGVQGLVIADNVIDMGPWQLVCGTDALNAAIFLENANGGNAEVSISGNDLNGGGYVLRIGPSSGVRVVGNRFGRDERYGLVLNTSGPGDIVEHSGNVRADSGEPVPIQ